MSASVDQVTKLLAEVRNGKRPLEDRRRAFAEAWQHAQPLSRYGWFSLHLVLVRHAVLLGDEDLAREHALALVTTMLEKPSPDICNTDSWLRDAMRRAVRALRVPMLAKTIGLALPDDVVPRIVEVARSDKSLDDRSRLEVSVTLLAGLELLETDAAVGAQLVLDALTLPEVTWWAHQKLGLGIYWLAKGAGHAALEAKIFELDRDEISTWQNIYPEAVPKQIKKAQKHWGAAFRKELVKKPTNEPIYEWDRLPPALARERINDELDQLAQQDDD